MLPLVLLIKFILLLIIFQISFSFNLLVAKIFFHSPWWLKWSQLGALISQIFYVHCFKMAFLIASWYPHEITVLANTLHGTFWLLRSLDCWWTLGVANDQWFCRTRHCVKSMLMHERFWLSTKKSGIYIQSLAEIYMYYLLYTFSCKYIQIIA